MRSLSSVYGLHPSVLTPAPCDISKADSISVLVWYSSAWFLESNSSSFIPLSPPFAFLNCNRRIKHRTAGINCLCGQSWGKKVVLVS